jgi:TonB family protein
VKALGAVLLLLVIGAGRLHAQTADKEWTDAYRPGGGVTVPKLVEEVKPRYTAAAVEAKVQGTVWIECVVEIDGAVRRARVVRSLDKRYGLDDEAMKAAKQWRFEPGTKDGQPVPVVVIIELGFTLRKDAAAPFALPEAFSAGAARKTADDAWKVSIIDTPTLTIAVHHPNGWTKGQDAPGLELTLGAPDAPMGALVVSPMPTTLPDMSPVPLENLRQTGNAIAASFKRPLRSVGQARIANRVWFWCDLGAGETGAKDRLWVFSTTTTGHQVVFGFVMAADATDAERLRAGGIFARMLDRLTFMRRKQPSR